MTGSERTLPMMIGDLRAILLSFRQPFNFGKGFCPDIEAASNILPEIFKVCGTEPI